MNRVIASRDDKRVLLIILGLSVVTHLYLVIRYSGRWVDFDTANTAYQIKAVYNDATIFSESSNPAGFAYQILSSFIVNVCHITIGDSQIYMFPLLGAISVIIAYPLFVELVKDRRVAILATLLLTFQPEFLFVTTRGNHEKVTLILIIIALLTLAKTMSLKTKDRARSRNYIMLFYVVVFSLVTSNCFFASSFMFLLTICLILVYLHIKAVNKKGLLQANVKRFMYSSMVSLLFIYLFIFYMYPPSKMLVSTFKTVARKISLFTLSFDIAFSPYKPIFEAWVSFDAWVYSMFFSWFIIIASMIAWVILTKDILNKRRLSLTLLWIFYMAFVLQYAATWYFDVVSPEIKNMQARIFPEFMLFAIPVAAIFLTKVLGAYPKKSKIKNLTIKVVFLVLMALGVSSTLLRVSHDPIISNTWLFYTSEEQYAGRWLSLHLIDQDVFADFDYRFGEIYDFNSDFNVFRLNRIYRYNSADYPLYSPQYWRRIKVDKSVYLLTSDVIKMRGMRLKQLIPYLGIGDKIYTNGDVHMTKIPYDLAYPFLLKQRG